MLICWAGATARLRHYSCDAVDVLAASGSRTTVDVILNQGSGKQDKHGLATTVTSTLAASAIDARVQITRDGRELIAARDRAVSSDALIVVAGGGDGTIATVAEGLIGTGKSLGILPLGTFNYFARTLDVPLDLNEALAVIAAGSVRSVDVGEVNGHLFLNNSSIGLYPAVLHTRESTYRRVGRSQVAAYVSVLLTLIQPPSIVNLAISADGRLLSRRTPLLFIGANPHQMESLGIVGASCIAERKLTLYVTMPMGAGKMVRLALRLLMKRLRRAEDFEVICAREILIGVGGRRVRVALDGEVRVLDTPLRYRMRHGAVRVIVPPDAAAQTARPSD
jgi:diacylglycerol kinase family enzyme